MKNKRNDNSHYRFQTTFHHNRLKGKSARPPPFFDSSLPAYVLGIDESGTADFLGPICIAGVMYQQPVNHPANIIWPKDLQDSKVILKSKDGIKKLFEIESQVILSGIYPFLNLYNFIFGNFTYRQLNSF